MKFTKRPSSKDVARVAGVSLGSVSRVINKFENVTPLVRERVEHAMAALDYRPNHIAQTLRSQTSRTVGCMLTDITNPLYARLFRAFEDSFRLAGYQVLLANSMNDPKWEVEILRTFRSRGLDGVLIAPSNERDREVIAAVEQLDIPAVVVDRDIAVERDHVRFDHARGIRAAALHLIDLGHRDIAILVARVASRPMRRRLEGFKAAFAARGLVAPERLIVKLTASTSNAFAATSELLASPRPPTAIFSLGTNVLGDVLSAISARGLAIPRDVSVVSMGSPEFARSHVPALATVTIDIDFAAGEGARLLLERMRSMMPMAKYAVPEMRKLKAGAIVNIASVAGLLNGTPSLLDPTNKGAVVNMTRSMAAHHGLEGIRVNRVAPGMVYTPMVVGRMTPEAREERRKRSLLQTEGSGWDVGHAVAHLASDEARWVTGVILPVDAGATAGQVKSPTLRADPTAAGRA